MKRRDLSGFIYSSQGLSGERKDLVFARILEAAGRFGLAGWKQLLLPALAAREDFFTALSPRHKERVLEDLARATRSMTKAGRGREAGGVLDEIYRLAEGPASGGEAAVFFRTRLREAADKQVKAALAGVILEIPGAENRPEEMAAALHGDHLLFIRAVERLCGLGDPGLRVLLGLLEEIALSPAVIYTVLNLVEGARGDETLKAELTAAVLRRVSRSRPEAPGRSGRQAAEPAVLLLRTSQVVQARRALGSPLWGPRRQVRKEPAFLRLCAVRKTKLKGGNHVGQENDTDAALRRGSPAHPAGPGGERVRLSAKLKGGGLRTDL
jgi:hypothetical protein